MSNISDLVDALAPVVAALKALDIPYYIGGSVASSFHGASRSTVDVDLVCEIRADDVSAFVTYFDEDYYLSESAIRDAVARKSCFNLIHLPTAFKVDIFVSRQRPFDTEAMHRACTQILGDDKRLDVPIATAEDSIISKLEWYRLSNETSQRQWEDVSRLIELLGDAADVDYLKTWAKSVGVDHLLAQLLTEK